MDKKIFLDHVYGFIKLISLYLNHEKSDYEIDDKTLSFYIRLAKAHSLRALLYKSITDTGVKVNGSLLKELEEAYLYNLRKTVMFEKKREDLYKYLNDNQVDYLPLKGLIIRNYYPDIYTREYADYDILFDEKAQKLVRNYFKNRGYEVKEYDIGNHDCYVKKPFFNFEMHRGLFEKRKDNELFVPYFKDCLKNSPVKQGYEHHLEDNELYIYITAHNYKHFRNAGCGLKTIVDYYLFLKGTKLDFNVINPELEKIGCLDFSNNITILSNKLFDNEPLSEDEEETLLYIASSGTYGLRNRLIENNVKRKGKFGYFLCRIFPPIRTFFIRYPWSKSIILLPLAWLVRVIASVTVDRKRTKAEVKAVNRIK